MSASDNYNYGGYTTANELRDAVVDGLLTQEEARLIFWSQFGVLRTQAASTPPPITD